MPGMMMKDKKPMSYKKGGMVKEPMAYMKGGMVEKSPMHKMPNGKMMPGAKHSAAKTKK